SDVIQLGPVAQLDVTQLRELRRGIEVPLRARSRHQHHLPSGPQQGTGRYVAFPGLRYRGEQAGPAPERTQWLVEALGVDHHRAVRPTDGFGEVGQECGGARSVDG